MLEPASHDIHVSLALLSFGVQCYSAVRTNDISKKTGDFKNLIKIINSVKRQFTHTSFAEEADDSHPALAVILSWRFSCDFKQDFPVERSVRPGRRTRGRLGHGLSEWVPHWPPTPPSSERDRRCEDVIQTAY